MRQARVLLIGSGGVMGRRILRLLEKYAPEATVLCASRSLPDGGATRRVDVSEPASLDRALNGIAVVINAVGPYDYDPGPILSACIRQGCHYIDLADDVGFVSRVSALAEGAPISVLSGCSTTPAMIEVIAGRWEDNPDVHRIEAHLAMGSKNPVSAALVYSLLLPLKESRTRTFDRLKRRDFGCGLHRLFGSYPSPFDGGGLTAANGRMVPTGFWISFDKTLYSVGLFIAGRILPMMPKSLIRLGANLLQPVAPLIRMAGGTQGFLAVEALNANGGVLYTVIVVAEREGLDVPALPSVWAACHLLENPDKAVRRLSDVLTYPDMKQLLETAGYPVHDDGPTPAAAVPAKSAV